MSFLKNTKNAFFDFYHKLEDILLITLLTSLIVISCYQIFQRNVAGMAVGWLDELNRILVLGIAMVGASVASREANHINIDLVSKLVSERTGHIVKIITSVFTASVCAVLAYYAVEFVKTEKESATMILGGIEAWIVELVIPFGFTGIAVRYLIFAKNLVFELFKKGEAA